MQISQSLSEFWRRWHISLGAWMRDYVFYPLALTKTMGRIGQTVKKYLGTINPKSNKDALFISDI